MSNQFCTSCGSSLRPDAKFCPSCGAPNASKAPEAGNATQLLDASDIASATGELAAVLPANDPTGSVRSDGIYFGDDGFDDAFAPSTGSQSIPITPVQPQKPKKKTPLIIGIIVVVVLVVLFGGCALLAGGGSTGGGIGESGQDFGTEGATALSEDGSVWLPSKIYFSYSEGDFTSCRTYAYDAGGMCTSLRMDYGEDFSTREYEVTSDKNGFPAAISGQSFKCIADATGKIGSVEYTFLSSGATYRTYTFEYNENGSLKSMTKDAADKESYDCLYEFDENGCLTYIKSSSADSSHSSAYRFTTNADEGKAYAFNASGSSNAEDVTTPSFVLTLDENGNVSECAWFSLEEPYYKVEWVKIDSPSAMGRINALLAGRGFNLVESSSFMEESPWFE